MDDLYIGLTTRKTRDFMNAGVLADLSALSIDIRAEAGGAYLVTAAEGTFHDLDILANKVSTGKYFAKITPDSTEALGVYLLYWTATYGTGGAAESFTVGPDVLVIHAEADIPVLADNYLSLDAISKFYPKLFDLEIPARILRIGALVSRDVDAMLDHRFNVPVQKRSDGTYDQPLIDATAALTVARVLYPKGYPEEAKEWEDRGNARVDGINSGRYRLEIEVTRDELGFSLPKPGSTNTSTNVELELDPNGRYGDVYKRKIIIKIDLAGAIGTATFKVSIDSGATWGVTGQKTSELYTYPSIGYGLGFRFFRLAASENLAVDDYWTIDALPLDREITVTSKGIRTGELVL